MTKLTNFPRDIINYILGYAPEKIPTIRITCRKWYKSGCIQSMSQDMLQQIFRYYPDERSTIRLVCKRWSNMGPMYLRDRLFYGEIKYKRVDFKYILHNNITNPGLIILVCPYMLRTPVPIKIDTLIVCGDGYSFGFYKKQIVIKRILRNTITDEIIENISGKTYRTTYMNSRLGYLWWTEFITQNNSYQLAARSFLSGYIGSCRTQKITL